MDESRRQSVLASVLDHFGVDKYNRLISGVTDTVKRGKFRYWQDEVFSELRDKTGFTITDIADYVELFADAATAKKEITLEQFLAEPSRYYYMEPVDIPDEWITQAWEQSDAFRENVTYEYSREASKNGDLGCLATSLRKLTSVLTMTRLVELYLSIREIAPHRESEFRPTFSTVLGTRMSQFPDPMTDEQLTAMLGEETARDFGIARPATE